jgi:hypothetical protein
MFDNNKKEFVLTDQRSAAREKSSITSRSVLYSRIVAIVLTLFILTTVTFLCVYILGLAKP